MKLSATKTFESYKKLLFSMKVLFGKFIFVFLLFFVTLGIGFFVAQSNIDWTEEFVAQMAENFVGLSEKSSSTLWFYIFIHNLSISLMVVALFFLLGIAPILTLSSNGLAVGVIVAYSITKLSASEVFLAIIPHGIFEIPAFLIATSLSLYLSKQFLLFFKKPRRKFKQDLFFALKIMLFVVTPLLLVASIIETFITPLLLTF